MCFCAAFSVIDPTRDGNADSQRELKPYASGSTWPSA